MGDDIIEAILNDADVVQEDIDLYSALDKGIEDMKNGRTLPLEEAFEMITELREKHRQSKF